MDLLIRPPGSTPKLVAPSHKWGAQAGRGGDTASQPGHRASLLGPQIFGH